MTRTKLTKKDYLQTTEEAERLIIKEVQTKTFLDEMECIKLNKRLSKESKITNLDPFIDDHGLLRVGGRLRNARLPADERHSVIIPGKHHSLVARSAFPLANKAPRATFYIWRSTICRLLDNR